VGGVMGTQDTMESALRALAEEHLATLQRLQKRFQIQHQRAIQLGGGESIGRGFLPEIEALGVAIAALVRAVNEFDWTTSPAPLHGDAPPARSDRRAS